MLQSTHKYEAAWPHVKLLYKRIHPNQNKYWSFIKFSSESDNLHFQKPFCVYKCVELHETSLSLAHQTLNTCGQTDHVACPCGVSRHV